MFQRCNGGIRSRTWLQQSVTVCLSYNTCAVPNTDAFQILETLFSDFIQRVTLADSAHLLHTCLKGFKCITVKQIKMIMNSKVEEARLSPNYPSDLHFDFGYLCLPLTFI